MEITNLIECILIISVQIICTIIICLFVNIKYEVLKQLMKLDRNDMFDLFKSTNALINTNTEELNQLSESLKVYTSTLLEKASNDNTHGKLPTPEEEKQITETIKDLIATEVALASSLRSPHKDSLKDIVFKTVDTYPDIDIEYICRKVVSIIELYTKGIS